MEIEPLREEDEMGIGKTFGYRVEVRSAGGPVTTASAPGKRPFEVATPPEFKDGVEGLWSPEDLLVAATAACFATTFAAVAKRRALEVASIVVNGLGHVERRVDGRFGFVAIELDVSIGAPRGQEEELEEAAERAEHACLVTAALDVPVHVEVAVRDLEGALS